MQADEN